LNEEFKRKETNRPTDQNVAQYEWKSGKSGKLKRFICAWKQWFGHAGEVNLQKTRCFAEKTGVICNRQSLSLRK
jgi:hypothetical protein